MVRTPTHAMDQAVSEAFARISRSLENVKGADANRQRKAVRKLANIADRLSDTQQIPSEPPSEVHLAPETAMDRATLRLFRAVQTLATWRFDPNTSLRERVVREAFDEIA